MPRRARNGLHWYEKNVQGERGCPQFGRPCLCTAASHDPQPTSQPRPPKGCTLIGRLLLSIGYSRSCPGPSLAAGSISGSAHELEVVVATELPSLWPAVFAHSSLARPAIEATKGLHANRGLNSLSLDATPVSRLRCRRGFKKWACYSHFPQTNPPRTSTCASSL